ncbi:MAG: hypothetical protein N2559_12905, partial [Anaerolineae bacterium]|nr:hypothetical protein [Anaerolineae bacterium]
AKRMGLRVLATPRTMGTLPLPRWIGNADEIDYLNKERYLRNWQTFLADNSFNQRFWRAVDIFNPLCEPAYKIEGLPYKNDLAKRRQYELSWKEAKSFNEQVFRMLEEKVPDHRLLHAYSPPHWAADVEKIFEDLPSGNNWVLEWHYYEQALTDPDLKRRPFEQELNLVKENLIREKRIPVYVGEMGWNNSLPYILNQFDLLSKEGIGYAYHAIDIRNNNTPEFTIVNPRGISLRGHIVTIYNRRFSSLR